MIDNSKIASQQQSISDPAEQCPSAIQQNDTKKNPNAIETIGKASVNTETQQAKATIRLLGQKICRLKAEQIIVALRATLAEKEKTINMLRDNSNQKDIELREAKVTIIIKEKVIDILLSKQISSSSTRNN
jgi:hypothetical protein